MRKIIIPVMCSMAALAVGYFIGGIRAGSVATEQAYHSDLGYFVAITRYIDENRVSKAKETARHGIQGALKVLNTFENEPGSSIVFLLPSSGMLLDHESRKSIRSQAERIISEKEASGTSGGSGSASPTDGPPFTR